MLYLNKTTIADIKFNWDNVIDCIQDTVGLLGEDDFCQPLKPYLRFSNLNNRIIAMPAYVGGKQPSAGIKWIASFPGNIAKKLPRANSVTILNDPETGIPKCIINTSVISEIRTAAVSGLLVREFIRNRNLPHYDIGIIGFGPIGQRHMNMLLSLLKGCSYTFYIYDIGEPTIGLDTLISKDNIHFISSWTEAYDGMDIFLTCTVSSETYINRKPKKGSLLLNISLRDFKPEIIEFVDVIVVDDWDEVCRQNTDIEVMHKEKGLQKDQTISLTDLVKNHLFEKMKSTDVIMFNPMGMAVFDIALATDFYQSAIGQHIGLELTD
jgi:2,3-diaminopropionate biosynthesis protein SbnB